MHLDGLRSAALSALLLAAASGCGSGSSGTGKISVHLMDAPGDYQQVNVDVQEVQIHGPNGWETIGTPDRVINLLDFTNGFTTTLVNEYGIEAGHYTQLRLVLGTRNSVLLEGESATHPLTVPSGMQSGIKLNVNFDVEPGTTKDVFIDFDAHRSVFVHDAGASGKYILRPVVFCYDKVITGSINGVVTDATTHQPLVGVEVSAQQVGTDGLPVVVRGTVTDATGHYVLSHLWVDQSFHVVTQPKVGEKIYGAYASPAIPLSAATPVVTQDIALTEAAAVGRIAGNVTPVAADGVFDEVVVLQTFSLGGADVRLQVGSVNATVTTVAPIVESYAVESLPAGTYGLYVFRSVGNPATASAAGVVTEGAVVTNAATTTVNLTAPTLP
jgi:hypothetical protein